MKLLFIDIEATGRDSLIQDLIQCSCMQMVDWEIINEFSVRCRPFDEDTVDSDVLGINNFTRAEIKRFPTHREAFKKLEQNLEIGWDGIPYPIVAHNGDIVKNFLSRWFVKGEVIKFFDYIDMRNDICLVALIKMLRAYNVMNCHPLTLMELCKQYNIPFSSIPSPMRDVKAVQELYMAICRDLRNLFHSKDMLGVQLDIFKE